MQKNNYNYQDQNFYITSKENPAIRHYRKLRDHKKARKTERLFVIEGLRIVRDALQYPDLVEQILITEKFRTQAQNSDSPEVFKIPEISKKIQILYISDAVGNDLSDTEHAQGIFAVCRMPVQKSIPEILRPEGKYLVLCNLQDPGNLGMILRTCDALGMDAVLTTGSCELYNPKTIRSAMGSALRVSVVDEPDAGKLLQLLRKQNITNYASVPAKNALSLTDCHFQSGCAVWIGNEGNGLPESIITLCDDAVTIPMRGGAESFNAAMAAGIFAWEIMKTKS
ncbi:MAG: RNA methyltransferase [Oscillospiraceae bacterium]|nr:RNA methyltransferase [Oscillospiraceae bacterium]